MPRAPTTVTDTASITDPKLRTHCPYSRVRKAIAFPPSQETNAERSSDGPRSHRPQGPGRCRARHGPSETNSCFFWMEAAPLWDPDLGGPKAQRSQTALGGQCGLPSTGGRLARAGTCLAPQ